MSRLSRPVLIYDGGCKFCVQQMRNMHKLVGDRYDAYSFREPSTLEKFSELSLEECEESIQFLDEDRNVFQGAEAFFKLLALRPHFKPFLWVYYIPGIRQLLEWLYHSIATHRHRIGLWFKS